MARETRQTQRVLLGSLLVLGLFATALLIFFMDRLIASFDENYEIHIVSADADGIIPESPVWVGGHEVGTVTAVGILPSRRDTLVRLVITVQLPTHVQPQIRTDSDVRITSVSFISERAVDILPGTSNAPVLEPGDTLRSAPPPSPAQLAARAEVVKLNLDTAIAGLRTHMPAIRARMRDTEDAFATLESVMDEARAIRSDVAANPGVALLQSPEFEASLRRTREHAAELPVMIARMRDSAGGAADVRRALTRLQLRADSLSAQLAAAAALLDNPNGTLARMQQDTALTRAIHAARAELDSLIADVRRNPLRYVF